MSNRTEKLTGSEELSREQSRDVNQETLDHAQEGRDTQQEALDQTRLPRRLPKHEQPAIADERPSGEALPSVRRPRGCALNARWFMPRRRFPEPMRSLPAPKASDPNPSNVTCRAVTRYV
jgi:hypothetical protein